MALAKSHELRKLIWMKNFVFKLNELDHEATKT